jgi:hypothetical protein
MSDNAQTAHRKMTTLSPEADALARARDDMGMMRSLITMALEQRNTEKIIEHILHIKAVADVVLRTLGYKPLD